MASVPNNSASKQLQQTAQTSQYDIRHEDIPWTEAKQYSALERIKMEREEEKAHPQEPLMPAKGIWKSRLCAIPALLVFGGGGG